MKSHKLKNDYVYQSALLGIFVICLTIFYYLMLSSTTYIGIGVTKSGQQWSINKLQKGGSAEQTGLLVGDTIISVDGKPITDKIAVKKWLVVEQAHRINIDRGGQSSSYTFIKNKVNLQRFGEFLIIVVVLLIFLGWYSQSQIISSRSRYFYYFLVSVILTLLAIVPSSIGNTIGRATIIIMISLFPLFISVFSYKNFVIKEQLRHNFIALLCFGILVVNTTLLLGNLILDMPMWVITYLDKGLFYTLFASLLVISIDRVFKKENKSSDANLVLLILLSMLPFLFCYFLQLGWQAPFSVVIPFFCLPIIAFFHRLTISKSLLFRYRIPEQVLYLIITAMFTLVMILLILLSHYVPLTILAIYGSLLTYALVSIMVEMVSLIRRDKKSNDDLALFLVAEEEREKISLHIHDTLIQDIVYFIRKLKENKHVATTDSEAIEILEETIYLLRELCTDVYPLMIQELGLKNALDNMANQLQKEYPVLITIKIEIAVIQLSEKMSNFVLRSVKELMNNSIFHGKAKQIILSIKEDGSDYHISIEDDGDFVIKENVSTSDNHFGLDIIKEKLRLLNGDLQIDTDKGTCISFTVPKMKEMNK